MWVEVGFDKWNLCFASGGPVYLILSSSSTLGTSECPIDTFVTLTKPFALSVHRFAPPACSVFSCCSMRLASLCLLSVSVWLPNCTFAWSLDASGSPARTGAVLLMHDRHHLARST
ncbi:hypothetical protein SCLCIDRAFT_444434 [Scleroderma citrinum Foug A]|uniref:Uncharacterized protein n=1 Tax=Scleroderma citrinum Foug A TaxID=1036808 RepID=A0A0C3EBI6_9AGAM|nr:hypothetical protein SCLCIDRAFT_444434 [Scleroderma citrinum Foug A]